MQETSAPAAYIVDDTVHKVTLAYKDQNTPVVTVTVKADNELRTGGVKIRKITEKFNYENIDFYNALAEGYVFGLYTAETIGDVPADVLVEVLTTDAQGVAESKAKLPYGNYYLKEFFVPDETPCICSKPISLSPSAANRTCSITTTPSTTPCSKRALAFTSSMKLTRERTLEGAVFEVRDASGKLFDTITTNKDGYAETIEIPVGVYKVKEVQSPAGFILSDEVKTVTLTTKDKKTAVFELTNKANEVKVRKLDSHTKQPLANADIKVTDTSGKVFFEGKTGTDGYINMTELPAGKYTWQEVVAPEAYSIDPALYSFTIDAYGKVAGDVQFANDPITLEILKMNTYTGAPMAGITFTLQDSEGKVVKTKQTDDGYRIPAEDGTETFGH